MYQARETIIQQFAMRFLLANLEEEDVREMLDEALIAASCAPLAEGEVAEIVEEGR